MISFVIPAHNEEHLIGKAIASIRAAEPQLSEPIEIIVVSDSSTDSTAQIAESWGVRVIHVSHRQISATRNAGARAAHGEILFFVDADTFANATAIQSGLDLIQQGCVGGGCVFTFDGTLPVWAKVLYPVAVFISHRLNLVGGCFLFCTRAAYDAVGGFPEKYYAAEEAGFITALKRIGRFEIPRPTVVTSGRKLRGNSCWTIIKVAFVWLFRGPQAFQTREGLELWYGPRSTKHDLVD